MRVMWVVVVSTLLSGPGTALGFVRETTTPGHPETGMCLWWGKRQVSFVINASSTSTSPCRDTTAAASLVGASFSSWSNATRAGEASSCTDFTLVNRGTTTSIALGNDGTNLLVFRRGICNDTSIVPVSDPCRQKAGACASKYNCWEHDPGTNVAESTIAITTTTFDTGTGEILDVDIEMNGWNGGSGGTSGLPAGWYFTCGTPQEPTCTKPGYSASDPTGQASCNYVDVGAVATHEVGHLLGLDHTCQYAAPFDSCPSGGTTMNPTFLPGELTARTLSQDDIAGVCSIYPIGGPTLKCGTATSSKSGGCGAGGGAGVGAVAAIVVALAGRRLRRGRSLRQPRR